MAQTEYTFPMSCGEVEFSTDYSTWVDVSGEAGKVQNAEQARMSGEYYTLDGDEALLEFGKRQPMEIQFEIVYNEQATEAYRMAKAEFEAANCGDPFYARWSPGEGVGDFKYATRENQSQIINFFYPPLDATASGPIVGTVTIRTSGIHAFAAAS